MATSSLAETEGTLSMPQSQPMAAAEARMITETTAVHMYHPRMFDNPMVLGRAEGLRVVDFGVLTACSYVIR